MKKNKAEYTPTEALSCLENVSKNAFYSDMKNGILSFEERQWGKKTRRYIDGAELARRYGENFKPQRLDSTSHQNKEVRTSTFNKPLENIKNNRALEIEVNVLREQTKTHKNTIKDLRDERDSWKKQAETLLLQHHATPTQSVRESDSIIYGTDSSKVALGSSGGIFGGLAAGILLMIGLGFVGTQYWSDISGYLGVDTASHDAKDVKELNSIAPASGHREPQEEIKGSNTPEIEIRFKHNYTPIPEGLNQ